MPNVAVTGELPYIQSLKGKMLGGTRAFGLPLPSATQEFPIGSLLYNDEGLGTIYKYVQATAATIALGDVVSYASGSTVATQAASAAGVATRAGVAPYAFTASYYGFIVVHGQATAKAGTVALGSVLVPTVGTAGTASALAPAGTYAQAEAVAAMSVMGVALGADSGGFASIFVNRCL
jgi:hypothetical protein